MRWLEDIYVFLAGIPYKLEGIADRVEAWSWLPGVSWLVTSIYWLSDRVSDIRRAVSVAMGWFGELEYRLDEFISQDWIRDWLRDPLGELEEVWEWFRDWWYEVGQRIDYWWTGVRILVWDWIDAARDYLIDRFDPLLRELQELIYSTKNYLIDWFNSELQELRGIAAAWDNFWTDILPTLASKLDVGEAINNLRLEWKDLLDFWGTKWQDVIEFFDDPLEWLYERVEDFMDKYW